MTRASIASIGPRLEKLLLMLSSDRDGEVVNAARAISRTLQSAGTDWHDLTGLLTTPLNTQAKKPRSDAGNDNWREMRAFCLAHSEMLRSRETEFVTGLADWRGNLTEKNLHG